MPPSVRASLWLFLADMAVSFAIIPFDPMQWPPRPATPVLVATILVGLSFFGALAFVALRTYQGRNWARWIQLVLIVLPLPRSIRDAAVHLGDATVFDTIHAALYCTAIIAVALLFTPTSNSWYRHASGRAAAS